MNAPRPWPLAVLLLLLVAAGCGDGLLQVKGRLTYQGKPVPRMLVTFQPHDASRASHGRTDDAGNFTLRYSRQQAGASAGWHTVWLQPIETNEDEPTKLSDDVNTLITRYGNPDTSNLRYEITRNDQFIAIDLK